MRGPTFAPVITPAQKKLKELAKKFRIGKGPQPGPEPGTSPSTGPFAFRPPGLPKAMTAEERFLAQMEPQTGRRALPSLLRKGVGLGPRQVGSEEQAWEAYEEQRAKGTYRPPPDFALEEIGPSFAKTVAAVPGSFLRRFRPTEEVATLRRQEAQAGKELRVEAQRQGGIEGLLASRADRQQYNEYLRTQRALTEAEAAQHAPPPAKGIGGAIGQQLGTMATFGLGLPPGQAAAGPGEPTRMGPGLGTVADIALTGAFLIPWERTGAQAMGRAAPAVRARVGAAARQLAEAPEAGGVRLPKGKVPAPAPAVAPAAKEQGLVVAKKTYQRYADGALRLSMDIRKAEQLKKAKPTAKILIDLFESPVPQTSSITEAKAWQDILIQEKLPFLAQQVNEWEVKYGKGVVSQAAKIPVAEGKPVGQVSVTPPPAAKEPWQMTAKEYSYSLHPPNKKGYVLLKQALEDVKIHEGLVAKALAEGKPVSPEVLAGYPELAAKAAALPPRSKWGEPGYVSSLGISPRQEMEDLRQGLAKGQLTLEGRTRLKGLELELGERLPATPGEEAYLASLGGPAAVPPRPIAPKVAKPPVAEVAPALAAKPIVERPLKVEGIKPRLRTSEETARLAEEARGRMGMGPPGAPPAESVVPAPDSWLPRVKSTEDILKQAYRPDWTRKLTDWAEGNRVLTPLAKLLHIAGESPRGPIPEGILLREAILADSESAIVGATARLRQLGSSQNLFKVSKEGLADIQGQRVALYDVLEHPNQYPLNPQQKAYAETLHKLYDDKLALLNREGIDVRTLTFDEGGHYVGRKVVGREVIEGQMEVAQVGRQGRVGAKAGFEKSRWFETEKEALDLGYRYLSPEEAAQVNLMAAYRRVADKRFADYILEKLPTRTAAAPEEIRLSKDFASKKLGAATRYKAVLERKLRGETIPEATWRSLASYFPDDTAALREVTDAKGIRGLRSRANVMVLESRVKFGDASKAMTKAMERARTTRLGEGIVPAPAFGGRFFDSETAIALRKALDLEAPGAARQLAQGVSWINAPARMFLTVFDVGWGTIQLQLLGLSKPRLWGKTMLRGFQTIGTERGYQRFLATHAETLKNWAPDGVIFTPSEFTETISKTGVVGRIPVARTVLKPFARGFEAALNAARVYGLESTEHMAKTATQRAELAAHWNEMTGVLSTSRMGISPGQRATEAALMFAPRYRRATAALVLDLARGGLRGKMAREAVAKAALAGMAGYVGLSYALGQEPNFDPVTDPKKFLSIRVGDQYIGIGGAYYGMVRLAAQITLDPENTPRYAWRFFTGLGSPVASTPMGVFYAIRYAQTPQEVGLKLSKEMILGNTVPIWGQTALLEGRWGQEGIEIATGLEFGGLRTSTAIKKGRQLGGMKLPSKGLQMPDIGRLIPWRPEPTPAPAGAEYVPWNKR